MKSRQQRLEVKRKRRNKRLAKRNNRLKPFENVNGTFRDPEINLNEIHSKIIIRMIKTHNSIVSGINSTVFHLFRGKYCFLSLEDGAPFAANPNDKELFSELGDEAIFTVPTLKVCYVCKKARGRNIQGELLSLVERYSEEYQEPILLFSDPFVLNKEWKAEDGRSAFVTFMEDGYTKSHNYAEDLEKQKQRFLKAGYVNASFEFAQVTTEDQHFISFPKTLPEKIRKVINSRLVA